VIFSLLHRDFRLALLMCAQLAVNFMRARFQNWPMYWNLSFRCPICCPCQ